jgi:hypothetical protein
MNKLKIFIFILSTVFMIGAYNYFISIKKINNRIADELKRGNFKDSETEFEKLLKKNKDNYILKFNYGNLKYKNSDYEESLNIYEKMLLRNEINDAVKSEIYYNIGNIYFIYDDYDKALEYYKHSLFLNPKDTDAIYNTEYILNLIRKNEEIEKMTEAFKKDLTEQKNKINGEELKINDILKETKIQKQIKNEQFQKIDKDTEEKNKINVEYIKNDLDYLLQERQTLLSQKNDLEKAISGMQEQTSGSGLSEEKASENLKLQEQKKNLEMKLKENLKKSNNKVNMLEKLEDDLFQEVVRPEKVINPKKIIDGYFAPSYADDKKILIEEEKEVIYRNLNQIDYADIEKKEEKKQIVYNMPPLEGDINKKSKYVYEHEDIIEYQNQQKTNSYVRNAFEQINLQKQKILENSSNEQSDILKEISEINKNILQKNINDEKQLMRQRQEAVNSLNRMDAEKTDIENKINSVQEIAAKNNLQNELNDMLNKKLLKQQEIDRLENNIESLQKQRINIKNEFEKNILDIKENFVTHRLETAKKMNDAAKELNKIYKKHDDVLNQKNYENINKNIPQMLRYEQQIDNNALIQKMAADKKQLLNKQYNKQLEVLKNNAVELDNIAGDKTMQEYDEILSGEKNKLDMQNQLNEKQKENVEKFRELLDEKSKVKIENDVLSLLEKQNLIQKNEIEKYRRQIDSQIDNILKKQQESVSLSEQKKELEAAYDEVLNKQMKLNSQRKSIEKMPDEQNKNEKINELISQEKSVEKDKHNIESQRQELIQTIKKGIKDFKAEMAKEYNRNTESLRRQNELEKELQQKTKELENILQQKSDEKNSAQLQDNKYELEKTILNKDANQEDLKKISDKQNLAEKKFNENIDMKLAKAKNEEKRLIEKQIENNKRQMQLLEDAIIKEKDNKIKEDLIKNKRYLQENTENLEKQATTDFEDAKDDFQNILENQKKRSFENMINNDKRADLNEYKIDKTSDFDIRKNMNELEKEKNALETEQIQINREQKELLTQLESTNRSLKEKVQAQKKLENLRQKAKRLNEIKKSIENEENKITELNENRKEESIKKFERLEKEQKFIQDAINENKNKIKEINEQKINMLNAKSKESIMNEMWRNQNKSGVNPEDNKIKQEQLEAAANKLKKQQEETRKLNNKLLQQQKMLEENIKNLKQNLKIKNEIQEEKPENKIQDSENAKRAAALKKQMQNIQRNIKDINKQLDKNKEEQMETEKNRQKAEHGQKWANSEKDILSAELKKQQEKLKSEKEKLDRILKKQAELEREMERLKRQYSENKNENIKEKMKNAERELIKTMDQRLQAGRTLNSNEINEIKAKHKNMEQESREYGNKVAEADAKLNKLRKSEEELKTEKNRLSDDFSKSMAEMSDLDADFDSEQNEPVADENKDVKGQKIGNQDLNRVLNFYGDMDKPQNDKKIKGQEIDANQRDW